MTPRRPPPVPRAKPRSLRTLSALGQVRLSKHFYMRNFLYSETAHLHGLNNLPDNPALAVAAGRGLCQTLLDPLVETFGSVVVRSAHRSPSVNEFSRQMYRDCAANEKNHAGHIWDRRDVEGRMGATASVAIPWFSRRFEAGRDWRDLAAFIHDHLRCEATFFPRLAAFNIRWVEGGGNRSIGSYIDPRGYYVRPGGLCLESADVRQSRYADFPAFNALALPQ